jgi:hypothetical protein
MRPRSVRPTRRRAAGSTWLAAAQRVRSNKTFGFLIEISYGQFGPEGPQLSGAAKRDAAFVRDDRACPATYRRCGFRAPRPSEVDHWFEQCRACALSADYRAPDARRAVICGEARQASSRAVAIANDGERFIPRLFRLFPRHSQDCVEMSQQAPRRDRRGSDLS